MILSRLLLPGMASRGGGHIVVVLFLAGKAASPRASIYNATKFGLRGFALALREDLAGDGGATASRPSCRDHLWRLNVCRVGGQDLPGIGTAMPEQVRQGGAASDRVEQGGDAVSPLEKRCGWPDFAHFFLLIAVLPSARAGTKAC